MDGGMRMNKLTKSQQKNKYFSMSNLCFQLTQYSTLFIPGFHVDDKMITKRTIELFFPEEDRGLKHGINIRMNGMSNTEVLPLNTITICIRCTCFLSSTMMKLFK